MSDPLDRFEKTLAGMALTVVIILMVIFFLDWAVGQGSEKGRGHTKGAPEVGAVKSFGPSPAIPQSEVKEIAELSARHLARGEVDAALALVAAHSVRCDWDLYTHFVFPNDIDRPYTRHRVRREAAIAGVQVGFGRHRETTVFVIVECP